jgi:disulfide bond formation protein DsbB
MYQRLALYVLIAVLTSIAAETSKSVLPMQYAVALKATLQALIAWRAYIDQTPAQNNLKSMMKE